MQLALSRHLGELGTISSSSHALGKFVAKNDCKLGLLPPTRRATGVLLGEADPVFKAILIFLSFELPWKKLLHALSEWALTPVLCLGTFLLCPCHLIIQLAEAG